VPPGTVGKRPASAPQSFSGCPAAGVCPYSPNRGDQNIYWSVPARERRIAKSKCSNTSRVCSAF
jgi:hypothetical protein